MGHERISLLPKTQKWLDISQQIAGMHVSETEVADIAQQTIQRVRSRFRHITEDNGVLGAFQFLVNLAVASREENPQAWLLDIGIELPDNPTSFSFAKAVSAWIAPKRDSLEYSEIAQKAAGDAISKWYRENQPKTGSLFQSLEDPFEAWRKAGNGRGFCELSRLFFAKFTQRYLEYFLEREVSAALGDIDNRIEFKQQLEKHVENISLHAFETAKITQSFAAAWFNENAKEGVPSERAIARFLSKSLGKMRDELQREGDKE
jgi:hypothetical protein